ncbi:MAG TPA: hypothetical protein ENK85_08585 [Saprospiraceae bacterium]|nr:hypothetical protein [Saprospiraceae bacterium]
MGYKVYGIRHHGPGSSVALQNALREQQPDCLIIEGPTDAESCIPIVADKKLRPPVAILVYRKRELATAAYFPFTGYSPEWLALKYGLKNKTEIRFMDLPQGLQFELSERKEKGIQTSLFSASFKEPVKMTELVMDPMRFIAQLAGYDDVERWWEVTFEHMGASESIFPVISRLIHELRAAQSEQSLETTFREAHMRMRIRQSLADGFQNIAIICGAWHLPALEDITLFSEREDKKLLRGLKTKHKTEAVWIPWSYERMTRAQYGAGVTSPAWYELLYQKKENAALYWMAKVATLLRKKEFPVSSAATIEAIRLANTLATMHGLAIPGLMELRDAAIAVICNGESEPMKWIEKKLIVGHKVGRVPESQMTSPLQKDLVARIKRARLTKFYNSAEAATKKLDLRVSSNMEASILLHQMLLLDIPWGKKNKGPKGQTGSFAEYWRLQWRPDYMIRVIDAGMWGKTIKNAAATKANHQLKDLEKPEALAELLALCLNSHLKETSIKVINQLEDAAALSSDVFGLMETLPPIFQILKYGSTRDIPQEALHIFVNHISPRIFTMLPGACTGKNDEAARKIYEQIISFHQGILSWDDEDLVKGWWQTLVKIMHHSGVPPFLSGALMRLLFDKGRLAYDEVVLRMSYALSERREPIRAVHWLEGFLIGSGLIFMYHRQLWDLVSQWVSSLPENRFQETLPLLRRAFSNYQPPERRKLLAKAKQYGQPKKTALAPADNEDVWVLAKVLLQER